MQREAFQTLEALEGSWWHYGRIAAVRAALKKVGGVTHGQRILDVGAGYGGMCDFLTEYGTVDAVERDASAREVCTKRGYVRTFGALDEVGSTLYDMVAAFDVIEHVEDDAVFVRALREHLRPGGVLVATVPAFQFLWSKHDEVHEHYRRYSLRVFRALLEGAGFKVRYAKFWNVALFLPAALMRLMNRGGESALKPHPIVERILKKLMDFESACVPHLPSLVGVSIVLVGRKDAESSLM